jgi:hypothetical protein
MGESWHNNHHAFPGSAKLGLEAGQADLGWGLITLFERMGLAHSIVTPDQLPDRPAVRRVAGMGQELHHLGNPQSGRAI